MGASRAMGHRDIVVIGASAGGAEALRDLCQGLPAEFPAAVFVVWHIPASSLGLLPRILEPSCKLPTGNAEHGNAIYPGHIVVAPPDHHMLLEDHHVRLTQGPKENRFRPAIDPLFRSAADTYGPRVIGVILAGSLDDGTSGLWAIKDRGGVAVVQDPTDTLFPGMPLSAISNIAVDHIVPVSQMADLLVKLVNEEIELPEPPAPGEMTIEVESAAMGETDEKRMAELGELSAFTCPECHGALWQIVEGKIIRFRCRTGHAYTAEVLLDELDESIERSLWASVRGLEENASLLAHMGRHLAEHGQNGISDQYLERAEETRSRAQTIRRAIEGKVDTERGVQGQA